MERDRQAGTQTDTDRHRERGGKKREKREDSDRIRETSRGIYTDRK